MAINAQPEAFKVPILIPVAPGLNIAGPDVTLGKNPFDAAGNVIHSATSGIKDLNSLANALGNPNTYVRIGEFMAGAILLGIGLNAVLKGRPSDTVRKSAKSVTRAATTVVPEAKAANVGRQVRRQVTRAPAKERFAVARKADTSVARQNRSITRAAQAQGKAQGGTLRQITKSATPKKASS